jgi:hypothetical protein
MDHRRLLAIIASLGMTFLVSWTVLPLVIPPFRPYSFFQLMEVVLWQGIGTVGWPFAIFGAILSLLFEPASVDGGLLLVLMYPAMLLLLLRVLTLAVPRRSQLIVLHLLLILSFAAVWYHVLNGYDFMLG